MIEIDNKYNIGDVLWKMYENKPKSYIVDSIEFKLFTDKRKLYYGVKRLNSGLITMYSEEQLDEMFYPTKEKCILSLFDK